MFVVAGVTGNTGSVVASRLLDAGKKVRVVVREEGKGRPFAERGAEVAVADLADATSLERALRGADGAYLLSPPDVKTNTFLADKERLADVFARAVRAAALPHVVLLSSIGAHHPTGTGPIRSMHAIEVALSATGVAMTSVRAAYFAENWAATLPVAKADGILPSFLPKDLAVPTVATKDIGIVAAQALVDGPRGRRTIALAGPVDPTPSDVAAAASRVLSRPVTLSEAPPEAILDAAPSFGASADVARLWREMYEGLISGHIAWEPSDGPIVRGETSVEDVFRARLAR